MSEKKQCPVCGSSKYFDHYGTGEYTCHSTHVLDKVPTPEESDGSLGPDSDALLSDISTPRESITTNPAKAMSEIPDCPKCGRAQAYPMCPSCIIKDAKAPAPEAFQNQVTCEEVTKKPNAPEADSAELLTLVSDARDVLSGELGDDPVGLDECESDEEIQSEFPLIYVFHRLLEAESLLKADNQTNSPEADSTSETPRTDALRNDKALASLHKHVPDEVWNFCGGMEQQLAQEIKGRETWVGLAMEQNKSLQREISDGVEAQHELEQQLSQTIKERDEAIGWKIDWKEKCLAAKEYAVDLCQDNERLEQQLATLREALERIASNEAFASPRAFDKHKDEEMLMRMEYAKTALASTNQNQKGQRP